ncbi:class I tRNA ligase family protein, partial [Candidatus Saccharibacteria bacterium]|nr:class I tRNA ligase family protein [Candidatus Saccharibacteria bacterium]
IAYDKDGNAHPIPEDQLPVMLPEIDDYKPDSSGRSALAKAKDWLKVEIPVVDPETGETHMEECTRETDTLDGYACSSWYLWRYVSPHDAKHAWDPAAIKYWAPTDIYVGADHAVAHLLYVRFWCKFFADEGYLPFREPIKKLIYHGYINAPDGKKMSKSKGNVIDPLDVINDGYGADTLRTYEMFIGPVELDAAWDPRSVGGVYRFLNRCWNLLLTISSSSDASGLSSQASASSPRRNCGSSEETAKSNAAIRNKTIKKVTEDIYKCQFNTAVAALMEYVNELYKVGATKEDLVILSKLLKPFAPHLASEMLERLGADDEWPKWEEKYLVADTAEVVVQVNGKLRAKLIVDVTDLEDEAKIVEMALAEKKVQKYTTEGVKKTIFVKKAKLVNIVV